MPNVENNGNIKYIIVINSISLISLSWASILFRSISHLNNKISILAEMAATRTEEVVMTGFQAGILLQGKRTKMAKSAICQV